MRVLVTGAFGYLGLATLRGLASEHQLVAFGHAPRNPRARAALPGGITVVEGDLADVPTVFRDHGRLDAVIHLAGGGGPQKCADDPIAAVRDNIRGTTTVLEAAAGAGVERLLFASTIAVYGTHRVSDRPYRETDDARPDDIYGVIKEAAEHAWTRVARGTALRIANIYGAGAGVDMGVSGAVERFARAAARGEEMKIFGAGSQRIDYVHVDDVVRAFAAAVHASALPPLLNIGGGAPISIAELAEASVEAGRAIGQSPSVTRQPAPEGKSWPDRSLDIGLARETLAWQPRTDYQAGIRELVEMMKAEAR